MNRILNKIIKITLAIKILNVNAIIEKYFVELEVFSITHVCIETLRIAHIV